MIEHSLEDLLDELTELCRQKALCWNINYSEAEDTYYADVSSPAPSEFREIKRGLSVESTISRLIEKVKTI